MYKVTSFRTDAEGIIYVCQWTYTNDVGSVGSSITLVAPVGDVVPVEAVTVEMITGWVVDALPSSTEELEAQIASNDARLKAEAEAIDYVLSEDGDTFTS